MEDNIEAESDPARREAYRDAVDLMRSARREIVLDNLDKAGECLTAALQIISTARGVQ